ncbi:MAG: tRNA lysidine(34) synthetase TilS [Pseudomonadota bacterium]|nr:tRNA lysidine(34) synthetase TilS [Pseudomonadota bacterium]
MTLRLDPQRALADALHDLPPTPLCVGFSGGLDSGSLLHALAALSAARERGLRARHIHHGLHPHADEWASHCQRICDQLDVTLTVAHVRVSPDGRGLEAAAREARHAALAADLLAGEVLVLAHHRDDQAETFLLRALRASGPDALGAMRRWRGFGPGLLWRPLLQTPRAALEAYARQHGLEWIDDPSNLDQSLDRNFLRERVLPALRERWPHADAALAASAALCEQSGNLLDVGDAQALVAAATAEPATLSLPALREIPPARRARVLRRWVLGLGLPPLPATGIDQIERSLLKAPADGETTFAWHGAAVRAWCGLLHADAEQPPLPANWQADWDGRAPLPLPGGGDLALIGADRLDEPVIVHGRHGGERIVLPGRTHSHALKHVLQERGVPPWQRARMPLASSADGELLAVADLVNCARFERWLGERGARLVWRMEVGPPVDDRN